MLITLVVHGANIFGASPGLVPKYQNMLVKTDTKERFHAITLPGPSLSASMTEELADCLLPYLQNDVKNVVLILKDIETMDNAAAEKLVNIQQKFYESSASFVICGLQKPVEEFLDKCELLEMMNVTPTESEAWDIVQMEEIEREYLDGDD
jgi:anti-anti-sigma factor